MKHHQAGIKAADVCREHGRAATFYGWKQKFGLDDVTQAQRLKALEDENCQLKLLVAELSHHGEALKGVIRKTAGASTHRIKNILRGPRLAGLRGDVAFVSAQYRLSEHTACKLVRIVRSSLGCTAPTRSGRWTHRRWVGDGPDGSHPERGRCLHARVSGAGLIPALVLAG